MFPLLPIGYDRPRAVHSSTGHDDAGDVRHSAVRADQLSLSARERSAERGLPDDFRFGEPARRQSGNHGLGGGDAAGKTILHHCGRGLDVLGERAGADVGHDSIHPRPRHRCRGAGRAIGDRQSVAPIAARHADAADLQQGESGRFADPVSGVVVRHVAAFDGGRLRADTPGAAHLDGERSGAGRRFRRANLRGARAAQSQSAGQPRHRRR